MKDKQYRDFIDSKPCLVCGGRSTHHHVRFPGHCGMGQKPSDLFCVPLCQNPDHTNLHNMGEMRFWKLHNIDIKMAIIKLNQEYILTLQDRLI